MELYSGYSRVLFLAGLPSIVFEICGGIIEFLQPNDGVVPSVGAPNLGAAGGCSARITNLDAPTMNLQYIKGKYADQPTKKKGTTPDRIHLLTLLSHRGCLLLIFKNICTCKMFCETLWSELGD
jgi:hypothetical protein